MSTGLTIVICTAIGCATLVALTYISARYGKNTTTTKENQ